MVVEEFSSRCSWCRSKAICVEPVGFRLQCVTASHKGAEYRPVDHRGEPPAGFVRLNVGGSRNGECSKFPKVDVFTIKAPTRAIGTNNKLHGKRPIARLLPLRLTLA
jgi:hypothetical protein